MAKKPFMKRLEAQQEKKKSAPPVSGIEQVIVNKQPDEHHRDTSAHQIMTHIARPDIEPEGQIIRVAIDDVYAEEQVRPEEDFEEEIIDGMVDTYNYVGLLTPPRCFPRDKRGYRIWLGETRWRSAKKRGDKVIDIYVGIPPESEKKRIIGQLIENLQQSGLKPLATAVQFLKLKNDHGMTGEQIAKLVGKPTSFVSKHLRLVDAPETVTALLREKITADVDLAYTLTQLHEVSPDSVTRLVSEARKNGITRKQAKEELDRVKRGENISHAKSNSSESAPSRKGRNKPKTEWVVAVEFDGQQGTIMMDKGPDENGLIWVKMDIGEIAIEPSCLVVKGLRSA